MSLLAEWLQQWSKLTRGAAGIALADARWVVVDCETSGLDASADRLLSIGAVRVRGDRIDLADTFSVVLRQERASDAANIVIHGIGGETQTSGEDPVAALEAFERFVGSDLAVGYHAPFDRAVLERTMREIRRLQWKRQWLDLAQLMPGLFPKQARNCKALDDWLAAHAIAHPGRHDALGDAYATAQLLQVALAEAARQRLRSVADLVTIERGARWLA